MVSSMETLRCRGPVAEPRQGEVMLETCSPLVTTCQGVRWRCGQGCPRGTGLGEQRRCCEGTRCVRGAGGESKRDALGSLGEITFCSLSVGEKPNSCAIGEKFPAELYWQRCCAICKSDYSEQREQWRATSLNQGMFPLSC